jgi:hypothetical protein
LQKSDRSLTVLKGSEVIPPFWKEEAYSFEPESIDGRGKAHGLYGYFFPGLRKAPRQSAAGPCLIPGKLQ